MTLTKRCSCPPTARCEHPYWYSFKLAGRRYRGSTRRSRKEDAERVVEQVHRAAQDERDGTTRRLPAPTLAEHVKAYVDWAKGDHPATAAKDELTLARFMAVIGPHKRIDRITTFDIERWRTARLRKGVQRNTVNRETYILSGCFSRAVKWKTLAVNPVKDVQKYRVDDARIRVLSPEEIQVVLTKAPADLALICRVTLECLPRLSEVLNLHRTDIGPSWIQVRRKGGRVERIPVSSELRIALLERLGGRTGYVFGDPPPEQVRTSQRFHYFFHKHGLTGVSHHTMRHTGVTLMLEAGVNPRVIQKLAGWTSLEQLQRYGHTRDSEARKAIAATAAMVRLALEGTQKGPHCESAPELEPAVSST